MTRRIALLTILILTLAGWSCTTGSVTLKAQSATIDSIKLIGVTAKLVSGPMDTICKQSLASTVATCDKWYLFIKGEEPTHAVCAAPTIPAIVTVLDKCGFKVAYPFIFRMYEEKKDVATGLASTVEAITKQLTGFGNVVVTGGKS